MRVSVVVVTAGINNYLKSCMDSIKGQTYPELEIIVIDNSLNQNFSQEIARSYPAIKLYSSPANLFYCASLNKGIDLSQGSFILCLNDDVILDKRFIEEALRGFFIESKVGMVSGKILRSDKKTIDTTGLFLSLFRTAKERGYGIKDIGQFERPGFIFGVNGAVAFYRKDMLDEIKINPPARLLKVDSAMVDTERPKLIRDVHGAVLGRECINSEYFDNDFHFFYEDLDIAWRAKNFGWKAYYIPQAIAYHTRGGSVRRPCGRDKPYARRYLSDEPHVDLIKNRYLTIIKNESRLDFLLHIPFIAIYDLMAWLYLLFFKPKLIITFFSNLKYIKSAFKKRKFLAQRLNFAINK